jgi:hypothetical protein
MQRSRSGSEMVIRSEPSGNGWAPMDCQPLTRGQTLLLVDWVDLRNFG